jgi:hemoglobin-like flavoprotein
MNSTGLKALFRQILALPPGLTERQQHLIRASYESLLPVREAASTLFYQRLAHDPRLNALFKREMNEQGHRLMAIMGTVVAHSHGLGRLVPALRDLGLRYDSYGVTDRDYDTVAAALVWTLEQELGADFTAETREAWTACYRILAHEMKAAANERNMPLMPPC